MTEEWKAIIGFPGHEVSNFGNVRSLDRLVNGRYSGHQNRIIGKLLKPVAQKRGGYLKVELRRKGATRKVHVLVCEAFHGPRPSPTHHVAHWDGDVKNNAATNLRWATRAENESDKYRHNKMPRGDRHWNSKLTPEQVIQIREHSGTHEMIALNFGINRSTVTIIKLRKSWSWL